MYLQKNNTAWNNAKFEFLKIFVSILCMTLMANRIYLTLGNQKLVFFLFLYTKFKIYGSHMCNELVAIKYINQILEYLKP